MTNTTTSIAAVVETYIASWNEGDAERRRELVGATFADDARYLDPLMSGSGIEGIADMIGAAQAQFPGHRFELDFGPTRTTTSCASPGRWSGTAARWPRASTSRPWLRMAGCVTSPGSSRLRRA